MEKKNNLFDESIREKLDDLKKDNPKTEHRTSPAKIPALLIAAVMTISILLRFFL